MRREDERMLTGGGTYTDDVPLPGARHAAFVRSPVAHARITGLDVADALAHPGVLRVLDGAALDVVMPPAMPMLDPRMGRPLLARHVVRFVGEPVAVVVAADRTAAEEGASLVFVDYEPLPVVVDPEEALRDEVVLFPAAGSNVALRVEPAGGDPCRDCEVVVAVRIVNQRLAPAPLEVRAAAASWDGERLTLWTGTQRPHLVRESLETLLGLARGTVRVVSPDVGGGFGAKGRPQPEDLAVAWLARDMGGAVRWVETRSESMVAMTHGRGQVQYVRLGGDVSGRIRGYDLRIVQDAGAYPGVGAYLAAGTGKMAQGVYDIPAVRVEATAVVTNTTPTSAYRGAGRPEATAAVERAVDLFAREVGLDPAEVRRRNLVTTFPFASQTGYVYDSGDYRAALEAVLERAGYAGLRAEQDRRRRAGDPRLLGIGLAVYVEVTSSFPGADHAAVSFTAGGRVAVLASSGPSGQGHETAWARVAADVLGVPAERVDVALGDTDRVPAGTGTIGSRSMQTIGVAVHDAAGRVRDEARRLAADLLEAHPGDVAFDPAAGRFHVVGAPWRGCSWDDLLAAEPDRAALSAVVEHVSGQPTFPFGAHLSVVEVDAETGFVTVLRHIAVDDAGTVIHPTLFAGQVHGGIAQGIGQALYEHFEYDESGNPQSGSFLTYCFPDAEQVPRPELITMETPTPHNPLGAKGVGESGTIGATPAVQNAVIDAVSHLGVRHIDMPLTPERVWRAIAAARG